MLNSLLNHFMVMIFFPFKYFIPKSNIIVLSSNSRYTYSDNTKYLYEYLSKKSNDKIYWVTDHPEIIKYLESKNMRYITTKSPLFLIWILLRTRIMIDCGTSFFNPFKILDNGKTIKITTSHGNGPKATISRFHPPNDSRIAIKQIINYHSFDYLNYPSTYSKVMVAKRNHLLPNEKIISLGYPRCDQFFDEILIKKNYKQKLLSKSLCKSMNSDSRVILYTPTWRPYDYDFPLYKMLGFDIVGFNEFLESRGCFFFYTIHTAQLPKNELKNQSNIIYIDCNKHPFFDINQFMMESDILFNDYSTTSTEFAILGKPQLFYMPDYEYYKEEKGFVEEYREILPGEEVSNFMELKDTIDNIVEYLKKIEK